ncbi:uncharacterized protein CC84DRAFT_494137 [Paraphaeosphaeria sporulosa]|uniref:Uncharacterized protein n=1 Tax=Paraphaeosphaeria sporulosa TaxID=1460663 RepID=A0A177CUU4_9PLEO|nr:uncharacterized protein CC84DRAFT_494137 [Paraphaeosphaeria sporulosa]OAG10788.1 hypothetical protein CC84DRAFT_494137 [Paraphaeosphaeria sporulosa]
MCDMQTDQASYQAITFHAYQKHNMGPLQGTALSVEEAPQATQGCQEVRRGQLCLAYLAREDLNSPIALLPCTTWTSKMGCSTRVIERRRPSPRRGDTGHGGRERLVCTLRFHWIRWAVGFSRTPKVRLPIPPTSSLADSSREDDAQHRWLPPVQFVCEVTAPCLDAQMPGSSP